ncbi:type II secretion system minor pseudopilin GspI [Colwelliaceae bacterium BS250]
MSVIKPNNKPRKLSTGFTLLEVMIALAVFALAGTALLKVAGSSLMGIGHLERVTLAEWIASNQLVEVNLEQKWPPTKRNGMVEMAGREWYWQQIVIATEDKNMRAITVEVREDEKDKSPLISLITYVNNPKAQK